MLNGRGRFTLVEGMAVDRDALERIREAVNLVELFEGVTAVRKVRGAFMALCPFHTEKTPSLSIDPARGLYHCFGCGAGGDVFTFMQETRGLSFAESLETLAEQTGIVIRRDPGASRRRERRKRLLEAVEEAGRYYHARLRQASDAGHARSYLRGRGYGGEVVERFELGYSPDEFDALVAHLRKQGFKEQDIAEAGLARRGGNRRLVDLMRGRLMFPIRNAAGDMVGFGGRLLEGEGPKYLNTSETPLYKKSELLYGLDRSRSSISREGTAVVVEGYTDVIAFHLADLPLAVATCGTSLGEGHFGLLRRFAPRIVLAFDADAAGAGAVVRGDELRVAADLDLDLRVAAMPEGRDPADMVREGRTQELKEAVAAAQTITRFRIDRILGQHDLSEPESAIRAMGEAAVMIARHPDEMARHRYASDVAVRTRLGLPEVLAGVRKALGRAGRYGPPRREAAPDTGPAPRRPSKGFDRSEEDLLRHLLAGAAPVDRVSTDLFDHPVARRLAARLLEESRRLPQGAPVPILEIEDRRLVDMALGLELKQDPPPLPVDDVLDHLEERSMKRRKDELRLRLESLNPGGEEYTRVMEELMVLQRRGSRKGAEQAWSPA